MRLGIVLMKWPYWLSGGLIAGFLTTMFWFLLPEDWTNGAFAPWFMAPILILLIPASFLYMLLAALTGLEVDDITLMFESESLSPSHLLSLTALNVFSLFAVSFIYGALAGLIVQKIKRQKDTGKTSSPPPA